MPLITGNDHVPNGRADRICAFDGARHIRARPATGPRKMTTIITAKLAARKAAPTRNSVSIGDYVRKTNSTDWVWQVIEFVTPAGHQPHARLLCVDHPADVRMFAVAAIKDRRLFVNAVKRERREGLPLPVEIARTRNPT